MFKQTGFSIDRYNEPSQAKRFEYMSQFAAPQILERLDAQLPSQEVKRLFHGRGRMVSGWEQINIEVYGPVLWVMVYQEIDETDLKEFLESAITRSKSWAIEHIYVQRRHIKADPVEIILGNDSYLEKDFVVEEFGLKYWVTLGKNQNTGLFLDMCNGRQWLVEHAESKKVLNLFSYTCSLGMAALKGGADHVLNLDMAKAVIKRGQQNLALNEFEPSRCSFIAQDIFKMFKKVTQKGPFDLIVADPPSFQSKAFNVRKDYKKMLEKLKPAVTENGELMLCLNSPALTPDFLTEMVLEVWPEAQLIGRVENPMVLKDQNEDAALKVMHYQL